MKKILLFLATIYLTQQTLLASPFYVNKGGGSGDGTAVSVAAVIAAGPSLGLVVSIEWQGITTTAASVAFNSVAMTAGPVTKCAAAMTLQSFYLANPGVGSFNITATLNSKLSLHEWEKVEKFNPYLGRFSVS
jgi:hypothetical protein